MRPCPPSPLRALRTSPRLACTLPASPSVGFLWDRPENPRQLARTGRPGPPFSWWPLARPQQPCPRSRTRSRAPQHAPNRRPALMRAGAPAHMPARAPDSVLPCCMRPSPCPSRAHVPHPARFARPASMRPGGLGSSSPASAAHRSLRDRRENHLNSTTIKPGLHFGKPGRFHTSRAITPSAGSQGSKRFAQIFQMVLYLMESCCL